MTLEQSHALKEAFEKAADETGYVSWLKCMQIAKDLDLEYEQVCSRCKCDCLWLQEDAQLSDVLC